MDFRASRKGEYTPPPPKTISRLHHIVTGIQVVMILSLMRLVMLQQKVEIFGIPYVDDGFRFLLRNGLRLLRDFGLAGNPY